MPDSHVPRKSTLVSDERTEVHRKSIDVHSGPETPASFRRIGKLMYRVTNYSHEDTFRDKTIPRVIIFLNTVVMPTMGLCTSVRGMYDGRVSLIGILLRILYFSIFMYTIYIDSRFEKLERWSRILPKLFGIVFIGIQLIGVIPNYTCDFNAPLTCL